MWRANCFRCVLQESSACVFKVDRCSCATRGHLAHGQQEVWLVGQRHVELKDQGLRIRISSYSIITTHTILTLNHWSLHVGSLHWFTQYERFHPYFSFLSNDTIRSTGLCNQVMDLLQWMAPRWKPWWRWAMVKLERCSIIWNLYSHYQIVHFFLGFEKYPAFFVQFFLAGGDRTFIQDLNWLNLLHDLSLRTTLNKCNWMWWICSPILMDGL